MQEFSSPEEPTTKSSARYNIMMLLAVIVIAVIASFLGYFSRYRQEKKVEKRYKNEIAKFYQIDEETLMKWIVHCCPSYIIEKYVSSPIQQIDIHEIYPYLGAPLPNYASTSKADLAKACYVSRSTLLRHFSKISDFKEWTGLSIENYKKDWRVFPPSLFEKLLLTYQVHYQLHLFPEVEEILSIP